MSKPRIPMVINGINFSKAMQRTGWAVEYEERSGNNAFLSLAGTYDYDILAFVPTIYCPLNALWIDELKQLRTAALSSVFVPVNTLDLDTGAAITGYFHATFGRISVPLITSTGYMAQDGAVLTLRGR